MYTLVTIQELSPAYDQQTIRLRGRVFAKKDCGSILFLILRDSLHMLQTVAVKNKGPSVQGSLPVIPDIAYNSLRKVENESFIEVIGKVVITTEPILACSQQWIELGVRGYKILSRSVLDLPITLKEAERIEEQQEEQGTNTIAYSKRLDHRVLDLRTSLTQAIFRINDGMLFYLQKYLRKQGFIEIKTPKLIGGASEGGANVFQLDYFGKPACLAQSPQLYKQMAIIGDFKRVFEIGSVFRAENSHTHRHLTEFVGIDLEMVIDQTYMEVVTLLYQLFTYLFEKLKQQYSTEIDMVQSFFKVAPLVLSPEWVMLTFAEAVELLQEEGHKREALADFTTEEEKQLSLIIRKQYQTDFYIVTHYPVHVRPFYTMPSEDAPYAYAYDFILRGTEVLSGAQRIHDYTLLVERMEALGIEGNSLHHYVEAFKYGAAPHAGAGIGLERLLRAFLGLPDIRYSSLFPRDPKRLYP